MPIQIVIWRAVAGNRYSIASPPSEDGHVAAKFGEVGYGGVEGISSQRSALSHQKDIRLLEGQGFKPRRPESIVAMA